MKIFWVFTFLVIGFSLKAEPSFVSQKLHDLFHLLPEEDQTYIAQKKSGHHFLEWTAGDSRIHFIKNDQELLHLGLNIFDRDEMRFFPPEIFYFIERFFLELALLDSREIERLKAQDNIKFEINGRSLSASQFGDMPSIIQTLVHTAMEKKLSKDSLNYLFETYDESMDIRLWFPANNNIIKGMDKSELDDYTQRFLLTYQDAYLHTFEKNAHEFLLPHKEFFVLKGEEYHKSITSNKYVKHKEDSLFVLFDKNYPDESFANIFLTGHPVMEKKLQIRHLQYGNKVEEYTIRLNQFLGFFYEQGYQLFFGIENSDEENMEATLILYNPFLNHANLLHIQSDMESLFDAEKTIRTRFFTHIPSDNIRSLFGIYLGTEKPFFYEE